MSYRSDRGRGGPRGGGDRGGFRGGGRGGFRGGDFRGGGGGFRGGPRGRGGPPGTREDGGIFSDPGQATNIDARLTDGSQEALIKSFATVPVAKRHTDLPLRPNFGVLGTRIKLRSNFFAAEQLPRGPLYEYDIKIDPPVSIRRVKRRIFELLEKTPQFAQFMNIVAHDYSAKLIAANKLPQPLKFPVAFYDEDESQPRQGGKTYNIEFIFIQDIDLSALARYVSGDVNYKDADISPILSALNIVVEKYATRNGVMVGRNRFFFPSETFSLGGGLEAWKGFYSSVRPTYKQLMVNVNVATTAFYSEGNLANAMFEFRNATGGGRIDPFVRGIRVATTHLNRRKTVKRASNQTAKSATFFWTEQNRQVSVAEYFRMKYNITLQYPDMPLIDVGGAKGNLLPAEVCQILPGQPFKGKLSDDHTAQMILHACKPPNVNARAIVGRGLNSLGFKDTQQPLLGFGIKIGSQMAVVPARILPLPKVIYSSRAQDVDNRASWNLRNVRFSRGATLDNWAVLVIKDGNRNDFSGSDDPDMRRTIAGFIDMCRKSGMTVQSQPRYITANLPRKDSNDLIRKGAINTIRSTILTLPQKVDLLMVLLSNGDKHIYAGIKRLCDVYLDVHTVCVHSEKIRKERGQLQYFANVALKFNMKLGGVNHGLDQDSFAWLKREKTMLVGMDVTHPGPGSIKGTPSIAAVVASYDDFYAQFPASLRIQESRKEMVSDLKTMIIERLELYLAKSRTLPQRILVYRDGVSEGQYSTVVREEMPEIIEAFRKYDRPGNPYRPRLSIVICGKRHHTRFYPIETGDADQLGNPRPGTVVDQGVTGVYSFDFFLQAHGGLQGTTRPTHYYVVHDEIGFSADELQKLTNDISYMFARATKAVSLVSPAYYADLACERGRCYIHELLQATDNSTISSGAEEQVMQNAKELWHTGAQGRVIRNSMFYL